MQTIITRRIFHVISPEGEAVLLLADLSMLAGKMDRQNLALVRAWASANTDVLMKEWRRLNER